MDGVQIFGARELPESDSHPIEKEISVPAEERSQIERLEEVDPTGTVTGDELKSTVDHSEIGPPLHSHEDNSEFQLNVASSVAAPGPSSADHTLRLEADAETDSETLQHVGDLGILANHYPTTPNTSNNIGESESESAAAASQKTRCQL